MSRTIRFLLCILLPLGLAGPVHAQAAVQLEEVQVNYEYGDEITFVARFQPVSLIQEAYLFFQAEGESAARSVLLTVAADGRTEYRHATGEDPIRPFSRIFFWYRTSLTDGGVFDSPRYFFQYEDNRYPWQVLEDDQVRVHWYGGDTQFGQQVFDSAHIALQSLGALIPLDPLHLPVDVFVYSSGVDIQETLRLGGYAWEAGHADPELGVVLVAITPEELQATPLPAQIPHELAHLLLYRMTGVGYAILPVWLTEGIASLVEQDSGADLTQVLDSAHEAGSLLPMGSLCAGFPADASNAILAYAQSASFTQYLYDLHGPAGLKSLVDSYARGESCEQGPRQAIGQPLSALEINWQQAVLGEDPPPAAVNNLLPYAVLLLLILLFPLGTLVHGWLRRAR